LGTFLESKVLQKLKFSNNVINEKCAPKIHHNLEHELILILIL
jgi:hypothetical protein